MTPKQALEMRKKLDDDKWHAEAAAFRLYTAAVEQIQSQCSHKWKQHTMLTGGYDSVTWDVCVGCGKQTDTKPAKKKGAKK